METCENCHRQIGDLETPCVLNDHVVCRECHEKLSRRESHGSVARSTDKSVAGANVVAAVRRTVARARRRPLFAAVGAGVLIALALLAWWFRPRYGAVAGEVWSGHTPLRGVEVYLVPRDNVVQLERRFHRVVLPREITAMRARCQRLRLAVARASVQPLYRKARAAYRKARAAYRKARATWGKAQATWGKAQATWDKTWADRKAPAAYRKASVAYYKASVVHYKASVVHREALGKWKDASRRQAKLTTALSTSSAILKREVQLQQQETGLASKHPRIFIAALLNWKTGAIVGPAFAKLLAASLARVTKTTSGFKGNFLSSHIPAGRYYVVAYNGGYVWMVPADVTGGATVTVHLSESTALGTALQW